jgi:hypothetical protein
MKRLLTMAFCAALTAILLPAQELKLIAEVPFAFHACNRLLPEGRYQIKSDGNSVLVIQPDRAAAGCFVLTHAGYDSKGNGVGRMVFDKIGNQYFLRSVWEGNSTGHEMPVSAQEKELIARNKAKEYQDQTVLALNGK